MHPKGLYSTRLHLCFALAINPICMKSQGRIKGVGAINDQILSYEKSGAVGDILKSIPRLHHLEFPDPSQKT